MSDIQTVWNVQKSVGDWVLSGAALASGNDLYTAVLISLFTDRLASIGDDIPDGTQNRRGWWADNQPDGTTDLIGSRLWLIDRSIAPTAQVLNNAIDYAKESLQWMVTDGVAASVDVTGVWSADNFLLLTVTIDQGNGTPAVALKYQLLWDNI